ncbi:hypothetical protein GCM10011521_20180 [Arenimonas soli]|uniref:AB hydrolase-1 domain-containing protein n=1 Tax=Arenimonas soli TaxID=2269504 RepID=A0ABQ1HM77_9GAMM|nr:alpha/beta fold hydrolase [Arenimonas soli]GGA81798.1 hypothetical protein GCM10011521_20180 [Arenimonas soli]
MPVLDFLPMQPGSLPALVAAMQLREQACPGLKPDNAARWIWRGAVGARAPLAIVYLHGFTASPGECADAPERLAAALGANAYVPRLPGHGLIADDALQGITEDDWLGAAREALAIGNALGERVVLVGSSLGASLATLLAADHADVVAAVVSWSLGVRPYDPAELDRLCASDDIVRDPRPRSEAQLTYWSAGVHPDGFLALRQLLATQMTPATAARVGVPYLLACYHGSSPQQDRTASVAAMREFFDALATPAEQRRFLAYSPGAHSIASPWRSAAAEAVLQDTISFVREYVPGAQDSVGA